MFYYSGSCHYKQNFFGLCYFRKRSFSFCQNDEKWKLTPKKGFSILRGCKKKISFYFWPNSVQQFLLFKKWISTSFPSISFFFSTSPPFFPSIIWLYAIKKWINLGRKEGKHRRSAKKSAGLKKGKGLKGENGH